MKTIFRSVVGDTPRIRVLEFLVEGRELDYSLSDIAEGANIGRVTLFRMWPMLEKQKIVTLTRKIGNAKLYRINESNAFAKELIELFDKVVLKKQVLKAVH